ncbi:hypothetical protein CYY_008194 [Polysphondylium violaceum]|uniref:FNIP repeat-containing protein n=1 Tax=Polysphondylium violaceum TaxID=133409 RepID=A0A8J4UXH3_9MYCE|nr:hypothetical protein CYY_008194 [Polysphondylium violaceum]
MENNNICIITNSIKELKFSALFNQPINNSILPRDLQALEINSGSIDEGYEIQIPRSIKRLVLNYKYISFIPVVNNIEYLEYDIPPYVAKIVIKNSDKQLVLNHQSIPREFNPVSGNFDIETQVSIDEIILSVFNSHGRSQREGPVVKANFQSQGHLFKSSTKKLSFTSFRALIPNGYLPCALDELVINDDKTVLAADAVPLTVRTLTLKSKHSIFVGYSGDRDFKSAIPKSVETLHVGGNKLEPSQVPAHVKEIKVDMEANYSYILKPTIEEPKERQYPPSNRAEDLFLFIWRISRLRSQIFDHNYRNVFNPPETSSITPTHLLEQLTINDIEYVAKLRHYIDGISYVNIGSYYHLVPASMRLKYIKLPGLYKLPQLPSTLSHITIQEYNKLPLQSDYALPPSVTYFNIKKIAVFHPGIVPASVRHLVLPKTIILPYSMPPNLKILEFHSDVSITSIKRHDIPSTVQEVIFPIEAYQNLNANSKIPEFIYEKTSLKFEIYRKSTVISPRTNTLVWLEDTIIEKGDVPDHIKRIIFGHKFNKVIVDDSIPATITELNFGKSFNQGFKKLYLPPSLKYLSLGSSFNQAVTENSLPYGLCRLSIPNTPNKNLDFTFLPETVSHLSLGTSKGGPVCHTIPPTVKHLKLRCSDTAPTPMISLPNTLQSLSSKYTLLQFFDPKPSEQATGGPTPIEAPETYPAHLKVQLLSRFSKFIKPNSLIPNINSIEFGNSFNQYIIPNTLSQSLTTLDFGYLFNRPLQKGCIPSSVQNLSLGDSFNLALERGTIPYGVKQLNLGQSFNQSIEGGVIPDSVEKLTIAYFGNAGIMQAIPSSVKELMIEKGDGQVPKFSCGALEHLSIATLGFNLALSICHVDRLPSTVKTLLLPNDFHGQIRDHVESLALPPTFNGTLKIKYANLFNH